MSTAYIDTHAHLNLSAFSTDASEVAEHCVGEAVTVVNVGTKAATSERAVELAQAIDNCYAIVGLHPIHTVPGHHDEAEIGPESEPFASQGEIFEVARYRTLATAEKVVGIGECGFDYYHTPAGSYEVQEAAFIAQIKLANELSLPLMIHTRGPRPGQPSPTGRSVYEDVYEVLKEYARVPFNVHFYAGTYEEAKRFFDIGGTISFTGVITFAQEYEAIIEKTPLELMHGETDCPYVAPVPHRGKRCEPWMVAEVYKKIAAIKKLPEATVQEQLLKNAHRQYGIAVS